MRSRARSRWRGRVEPPECQSNSGVRNAKICKKSQYKTAPHGCAIQSSYERLRETPEGIVDRTETCHPGRDFPCVAETGSLIQILPCAKSTFSCAGDNCGPHSGLAASLRTETSWARVLPDQALLTDGRSMTITRIAPCMEVRTWDRLPVVIRCPTRPAAANPPWRALAILSGSPPFPRRAAGQGCRQLQAFARAAVSRSAR